MNDLVKGLRGELLDCKCNAYCYGECGCHTTWPESLCRDAADEIEMQEALLREIDRELDDVEYLGSYVDGIKALKAEIERLERVSELKSDRIEELERELFGEDMSAVTMVDLLQEQLAACQKEQDKSLRHYVAKELREMAGDEFQGVNIGWRYKLRRRADELENGRDCPRRKE